MTKVEREKLMGEYAAWVATPKRLRRQLKLPVTIADFAELKGVTERTLYRWNNEPYFTKLVEQAKLRYLGDTPNASVNPELEAIAGRASPAKDARVQRRLEAAAQPATVEDDLLASDAELDEAEREYRKVRQELVSMAEDGRLPAIEAYMKLFGRPFIEAELNTDSPYVHLDDEELVGQVLAEIGEEAVAEWLGRRMQQEVM